jgi:hypothetical protein
MMETIAHIAATRTGKVLLALWLLALVAFIAVPVTGLFQGEFLGNLAFIVLPVGILLNISIVLAHYVENGSVRIVKAAWIGIAVVALLITLYAFDGKPNSDIGVFLAWFTLVLAFPISWLVALLFTGVAIATEKFFSAVIPTSYVWLLVSWACFIAAGYWQWFMLLPWLWRKWKTRHITDAAPSL